MIATEMQSERKWGREKEESSPFPVGKKVALPAKVRELEEEEEENPEIEVKPSPLTHTSELETFWNSRIHTVLYSTHTVGTVQQKAFYTLCEYEYLILPSIKSVPQYKIPRRPTAVQLHWLPPLLLLLECNYRIQLRRKGRRRRRGERHPWEGPSRRSPTLLR